jgi:hypothetical protein
MSDKKGKKCAQPPGISLCNIVTLLPGFDVGIDSPECWQNLGDTPAAANTGGANPTQSNASVPGNCGSDHAAHARAQHTVRKILLLEDHD